LARERGIVKIEVLDPINNCESKAEIIRSNFNLEHVVVIPRSHPYTDLNLRAIAGAAAKYLEQKIRDGEILGVAWGRTISRMSELLASSVPRQIEIVPLSGELGNNGNYSQINQIVLKVSKSFIARPHFLFVPTVVYSKHLKEELLKDPEINEVVNRWDRLDMAVIGIGAVPPKLSSAVYVGSQYNEMMLKKGAVGDICGIYFDGDGNLVDAEFYERMIGIRLPQLKNTGHVIAVAGGVAKIRAVFAALKMGFIDALFIDEMLAEGILLEI
jgi:DNA-binding transcriptional regulator LsrR (DeoR family)